MKFRLYQFLIGVDQLINTILGSGWSDETLSSCAWRNQNWQYKFIDKLFFWQEEHCKSACLSEQDRMQLPPEFRK